MKKFNILFFLIPLLTFSQDKRPFDQNLTNGNDNLFKRIDLAESFVRKAYSLAEDTKDSVKVFYLIGRLNLYKGDRKAARDTLLIAYHLILSVFAHTDSDSDYRKEKILNSLGETYKDEQNYDSAKRYYDSALNSIHRSKLKSKYSDSVMSYTEAMILNNLGELLLYQNKTDSALNYYFKKIEKKFQTGSNKSFKRALAYVYENIGRCYEKQGQLDLAREYFKQSLIIRNDQKKDNLYEFIMIAYTIGIFDHVYEDKKISPDKDYYLIARDSLKSYNISGITNYLANHTISSIRNDITLRDAENKTKWIAILIAGLFVIVATYAKFIANNRQKQKKDLLVLNKIGESISAAIKPGDTDMLKLVGSINNEINALVDAPIILIAIYDERMNQLDYYVIEKNVYLNATSRSLNLQKNLIVDCFKSNNPIFISDYKSTDYPDAIENQGDTPESVAAFQIVINKKKLGVFSVQSFKKNAYVKKEKTLKNLANKVSIAVNNFLTNQQLYETMAIRGTILSMLKHDLPYAHDNVVKLLKTANFDLESKAQLENTKEQLGDYLDLMKGLNKEMQKVHLPRILEPIESYFIGNIVANHKEFFELSNIELELDPICIAKWTAFKSDKNLLWFVLKVFLNNAYKAILASKINEESKGKIVVSVEMEDGANEEMMIMCVNDNGVGLPKEDDTEIKFEEGAGNGIVLSKMLVDDYTDYFIKKRLGKNQTLNNIILENHEDSPGCIAILRLPVTI